MSEEWESCIIRYESEISERLRVLEELLAGYISEMTGYICPRAEESMMRVDRSDIWFNLTQIEEGISELSHIWMDTESSYADYRNYTTIGGSEAELAARILMEEIERQRREGNYNALQNVRNAVKQRQDGVLQDTLDEMWNIYNNSVIPFEETDDFYCSRLDSCYDEWATITDKLTDWGNTGKSIAEGIVDPVSDMLESSCAFSEYLSVGNQLLYRLGLLGLVDSGKEEMMLGMDAGIVSLVSDPENTLGAIGQHMADTVDERGLAYSISYVVSSVAMDILIEKGVGKLSGGKTISYTDFEHIYQNSIRNPNAKKVMLGKYDGGGPTSYIIKAGDEYTYFNLGTEWNTIRAQYGFTENDMFHLFNESFLDDAINAGKTVQFSHDPVGDIGALGQEYQYLLDNGYLWDTKTMTMGPQ